MGREAVAAAFQAVEGVVDRVMVVGAKGQAEAVEATLAEAAAGGRGPPYPGGRTRRPVRGRMARA